jgi:hypothetical protein
MRGAIGQLSGGGGSGGVACTAAPGSPGSLRCNRFAGACGVKNIVQCCTGWGKRAHSCIIQRGIWRINSSGCAGRGRGLL